MVKRDKSPKRYKGCGRFTNHWHEITASKHSRGLVVNPNVYNHHRCGEWTVPGYWQCICNRCYKRLGLEW